MKKVIIHIGANKTGTTSIQSYCSKYSDSLIKNHGVLYPNTGRIWNAHFKLAWSLGAGKGEVDPSPDIWTDLRNEVEAAKCDKIVLSSENFILIENSNQLSQIKDTFHDYEFEIVLFVRRQDYWIESLFLQRIKMGLLEKDFNQFVSSPGQALDYKKILTPWIDVFGKESIIVVNFETEVKEKGAVTCFFQAIKVPLENIKEIRDNDSIDRFIAEFLRSKRAGFKRKDRVKKILSLYHKKIKPNLVVTPSKYYFTEKNRSDFLKNYIISNEYIANEFFLSNDLFSLECMPDGHEKVDPAGFHDVVSKIFFELLDEY
jgi:hypothetical protein